MRIKNRLLPPSVEEITNALPVFQITLRCQYEASLAYKIRARCSEEAASIADSMARGGEVRYADEVPPSHIESLGATKLLGVEVLGTRQTTMGEPLGPADLQLEEDAEIIDNRDSDMPELN